VGGRIEHLKGWTGLTEKAENETNAK